MDHRTGLKGGAARAARLPTVREPRARADRLAAVPTEGLTAGSLVCPLFTTPGGRAHTPADSFRRVSSKSASG